MRLKELKSFFGERVGGRSITGEDTVAVVYEQNLSKWINDGGVWINPLIETKGRLNAYSGRDVRIWNGVQGIVEKQESKRRSGDCV